MHVFRPVPAFLAMAAMAGALAAQDAIPVSTDAKPAAEPDHKTFLIETGTRIPLSMVNSVSTKTTGEGDRVYLETSFPIAVNGKIVIPAGSYVLGTVTSSKRPGKVKGRGEFRLRFDSLMLPNGVTRDFRAQVAGLDGRATEDLDKKEGTIRSEGSKADDARVIAETATTGAAVGGLAGLGRAPGLGAGIGAMAGATAAMIGVLVTRGPDAVLAKGTTVEMVLDRQLSYDEAELNFSNLPPRYNSNDGGGPLPSRKGQATRHFP